MLYRQQFSVSVGLTDTPLLGPNERRVKLIISAPAANRLTLSFNGAAVDKAGVTLYAGNPPLVLDEEHIGQAIREEIRAIMAVAGETIGGLDIFEVACDCPVGQQIERRLRT